MNNGRGMGNSAAVPGLGNVYAPPGYAGLGSAGPQYVDLDYTYVYDVVLTANQVLPDQQVPLQTDAEFEWRVVIKASATGAFSFRFSDSQGFQLSSGYLNSSVLDSGGAANPFPIFPSLLFPKGGRIGVDIADLSGAGNTIQLLFRGVKRYEIPGTA